MTVADRQIPDRLAIELLVNQLIPALGHCVPTSGR
jgi:hypothetical protein